MEMNERLKRGEVYEEAKGFMKDAFDREER